MDGGLDTTIEETPFVRLDGVSTQAATSSNVAFENTKISLKRDLPWLHKLPEFQKIKGQDKKIALIAGGPSIKDYVDDIRQFKTTMVCGSSNDWAMDNNILPTYSVICDPDPISINYYQKLDTETKYMIAAACDPKIFDHLKGQQIVLWHCHSEEVKAKLDEENLGADYNAISGGCTVGLRALSMAIMLGYTNIHMFGFDSCLGVNDKHHAYDFSDVSEELGVIHNIRIGDQKEPNSLTFRCAGYQLAQVVNFKDFYAAHHQLFNPVVYGNGLLAAMLENINKAVLNAQPETIINE